MNISKRLAYKTKTAIKYVPSKPVIAIASSAACRDRNPSPAAAACDKLRAEKAVNSNRDKRRHIIYYDQNPSQPAVACGKRQIKCRARKT